MFASFVGQVACLLPPLQFPSPPKTPLIPPGKNLGLPGYPPPQSMDPTTPKHCTKCRQLFPLTAFSSSAYARDGMNQQCRTCRSLVSREWRTLNPRKAQWKSAREAVVRELGPEVVTPGRIAAKIEALRTAERALGRRKEVQQSARQAPASPVPPGTMTREALLTACGISPATLQNHRWWNTAGIQDAVQYGQRTIKAGRAPVFFQIEKAAPFIALMQARPMYRRRHVVDPIIEPHPLGVIESMAEGVESQGGWAGS